jgi:hypothetical protein
MVTKYGDFTYKGIGAGFEEMTTEIAARKIAREVAGSTAGVTTPGVAFQLPKYRPHRQKIGTKVHYYLKPDWGDIPKDHTFYQPLGSYGKYCEGAVRVVAQVLVSEGEAAMATAAVRVENAALKLKQRKTLVPNRNAGIREFVDALNLTKAQADEVFQILIGRGSPFDGNGEFMFVYKSQRNSAGDIEKAWKKLNPDD